MEGEGEGREGKEIKTPLLNGLPTGLRLSVVNFTYITSCC